MCVNVFLLSKYQFTQCIFKCKTRERARKIVCGAQQLNENSFLHTLTTVCMHASRAQLDLPLDSDDDKINNLIYDIQ